MVDIATALAHSVAGAETVPRSPVEFKGNQYVSRQLLVQQVAYNLSATIFNYSPSSLNLDRAVRSWSESQQVNLAGKVPHLMNLESRAGSGAALLGYLRATTQNGPAAVLLTAGAFKFMLPVLLQNQALLSKLNVAFHVAAVDYNQTDAKLTNDFDTPLAIARQLGWPAVISNLGANALDVQQTAVLASQLATSGPAVHVYDGLRGSAQLSVVPVLDPATYANVPPSNPGNVGDAIATINATLGAKLAALEVVKAADAQAAVVGVGSALLYGLESITKVNVRLYTATVAQNILEQVTASRFYVLDAGLYKELAAASHLVFGPGRGPSVEFVEAESTIELAEKVGATAIAVDERSSGVFFDADNSRAAGAPAAIARFAQADFYPVFDSFVNGGSVESDVRLADSAPQRVENAPFVYAGAFSVAKSVDLAARAAQGANLVIGAPADKVAKLSAVAKRSIAAKELNVYTLDFNQLDTSNTQGRTASMAVQAAFWYLGGGDKLTIDQITTKIVQATGQDTELVAATVNKLVTSVIEKGLVTVDTKEWATASDEHEEELPSGFTPRSLVPMQIATNEDEDAGPGVEELTASQVAQRFVFSEAFNEKEELRPEVSAKTVIAKVQVNQRVTPSTYDRHIFHLELDISGTGLTYAIGEALGVHAPNNIDDVNEFMEWYGIDAKEVVGVTHGDDASVLEYKTAFQALRDNLDLFGKVPKRFYEELAHYATNEEQRTKLELLALPAGAEELKRRTEVDFDNYVDILREFSSAHPPFAKLAEMIAPLKRREYSIASSQKVHPNAVHLLIVVVDWVDKNGNKRYGQCSKFLADLHRGAEVTVSVKPSVMKLPKDPKTPIIMAGLGTGLAPFKAFLEEKMWQRDQGHDIGEVYLFLGSRHQREEYLYGELFEAFKTAGVLTHIGAAFSRDQPEKIYIQHRILQAKPELTDAFVKKTGNFYLCGPTWPVPDVSAALSDIVIAEAATRNEKVDAGRLIETLKDDERYILEVY